MTARAHPGRAALALSRPALASDAAALRSPGRRALERLVANRAAVASAAFLLLLVAAAVAAPFLFPGEMNAMRFDQRLRPPGWEHPFGTDRYGRDILVRILYAGRVSLAVGVVSVSMGAVAGSLLGAVSGLAGGWPDLVAMRAMDVLQSFPAVLLAMALVGVLGPGVFNLMLAIAVVTVPTFARVARSGVLQVASQPYVEAARAVGATGARILLRHVLPNILSFLVVTASLQIGSAILAASSLSFLGLGVQPPTPEWGSMLAEGRGYLQGAPWMSLFPGLVLALTVIAFNLLGDGLRDALSPKTTGGIP